jgi:hypothetical protein
MTTLNRLGRIPAGVADSGASSLAAFIAGLVAIHTLDIAELGMYAIFFSAFLAGTYIPRHLVFMPVEMASVKLDPSSRRTLVAKSIPIGLLPALLGSAVIGLAVLATARRAESALLTQLAVTSAIATFVSPIQDHVRRLLHLSDRSWSAVMVSVTQLVIVALAAIAAMAPDHVIDIAPGWLPFGSLVVANLVSLAMGVIASLYPRTRAAVIDFSYRSLSRPGRWLLLSGLTTKGTLLVATALIGHFAGNEALGFAEAARQVAQPVMVLGIGLADGLSPRLMGAGHHRDRRAGIESERHFSLVFWGLGLVYLLVVSFDWVGNPMARLIPQAYGVTGLVLISVLANLIVSALYPYRLELMGGRAERSMARVDVYSAIGPILVGLFSAPLLAFARPLGLIANGAIQGVGYRRATRRMYESGTEPTAAEVVAPPDPSLPVESQGS